MGVGMVMGVGCGHGHGCVPVTSSSPSVQTQKGIRPIMFKTVIGRGHAEFSSNRQQDASEFLLHLLSNIERADRALAGSDTHSIISMFQFQVWVNNI